MRAAGGDSGQKLWGTCVPDSRFIVLAARTDPAAFPPHAGISLFLVDLDSPGISVQEHRSFGGDVSATTFWDDVDAGARTEALMAKVMATELAEDLNVTAISLLGPDALAGFGVRGTVGDGYFEDGLRSIRAPAG